ncbi:class I SAM-dependent methyltransferase [Nonomuraea sp. NPDC050202]|jgi:hypothetical protein|uniref:class I SAM-dependent methyltransferase n=1 Tax=Nonomuraea sp. NPDC050202 TaxID=3155035 RepID=UPI0033F790B9
MFSIHRHHRLVERLTRAHEPVAQAGPFTLHWLNPPGGADRDIEPELMVVHDLHLSEIDNNVGKHIRHSLIPMLASTRHRFGMDLPVWGVWEKEPHALFNQLMTITLYSVHADPYTCSRWFYRNTLKALREPPGDIDPTDFIQPFSVIYRRVRELRLGESLLDAGTCHGFLPLLLSADLPATGHPSPQLVGLDIEEFFIQAARKYAEDQGISGADFLAADLFDPRVEFLPRFDTVTAIHLLEHLDSDTAARALDVLWKRTAQRLIINVPIEETPDPYFGHCQRFDVGRLADMGERLGGHSTTFEDHGAWLVVDR